VECSPHWYNAKPKGEHALKIGFLVNTTPYTFQNTTTAVSLIKAALKKGHSCDVFLFVDGVVNASGLIKSPGNVNVADEWGELVKQGVKVSLCGECAHFRGVAKGNLIEGAKVAGTMRLSQIASKADRFITLGI
jgi:tRNA 2-thiouridine synthesizing protein D